MKKYLFVTFLFLLINLVLKAQPTTSLEHHPEKGILPFNAPCTDCVEDLAKRTGNVREFFKKEKGGGKTIYRQQSLGDMSFKDANGYWRTVDPQLKEESANVFAAHMQPSPVVIDFQNKITSITNAGKEFRFNKNISLVHVSAAGVETNLGAGNWSHISKTTNNSETYFLIKDFYPGVDLEMMATYGRVESNFILKNRLPFTDGVLKMKEEIQIPYGLKADMSTTTDEGGGKKKGMLSINDDNGGNYFYFRKSFAHDADESSENYFEMPFSLNNDQLTYFIPVYWLNDAHTAYPVIIDPLVSSTNTIPQISINGSGYTPVCGTLGCSYFMNNFPTPDSCEITAIYTNFTYLASLPCVRADGGFDITMTSSLGSCTSRNFTCVGTVQGQCNFQPAQLLDVNNSLSPCVLSAQCSSYNVDFEMKFRRCNQLNQTGCDATCILAYSPWIMTIEGKTLQVVPIPPLICGDTNVLSVGPLYGVGPYSILWSPSGDTTPSILIAPNGTTNYSVIVSDGCGNSDSSSQVVNAVPSYYNSGFVIFPNDTLCGGEQVLMTSNINADSLIQWYIYSDSVYTNYFNLTSQISLIVSGSTNNVLVKFYYRVDSLGSYCNFIDSARIFIKDPMAYFTLTADTSPYNWIATNLASWVAPLNYLWDWGDSTTSTGPNPTHTYADTGSYIICLTVTDSAGCTNTYCDSSGTMMLTVNSQFGVGITAEENANGISIFPNPAESQFLVSSSKFVITAVEIYDVLGKKANSKQNTVDKKEITIDVGELTAGIYFVKVQCAKMSVLRKLVVD